MDEKVKCSFCNKEILCPPTMLNSEKHICFECFQTKPEIQEMDLGRVHIDIPPDKISEIGPDLLMGDVMSGVFPEVWQDNKEKLKDLSKKDLAQEMFAAGAMAILNLMEDMHAKQARHESGQDEEIIGR